MKTLIYNLFIHNWQRKSIAVLLAIITWFVVNHSLISTKTVANIPVRIINIPSGKTVEGIQNNGRLNKRITLTLVGNKTLLDEVTPNDIEVVIDAADKPDEWVAAITKKNLVTLNPELDISKGINRVFHPNLIIRLTKLVTDKIPIVITQPIGEAPRGYQFLDVWPYRLTLTVSGPEEVIKRLKTKEQKLTFNLNDVSKGQLDSLAASSSGGKGDVVSFFIPDQWKQLNIPLISDSPIEVNDSLAKALRIDFIRYNLIPLETALPISVFFPTEFSTSLNPSSIRLAPSDAIHEVNGIPLLSSTLHAKGVDRLFVQVVRDMIEIVVIAAPRNEQEYLEWSVQFINSRTLEDKYVATLMSDVSDEDIRLLQPSLREEYLRNRFRSYMNRFQLFRTDDTKF